MKERIHFNLNGRDASVELDREKMLLDILREDFSLTGTKCGCDNGTCGACTVVFNGAATKSCLLSSKKLEGSSILTIEGLSVDSVNPIQQALVEAGAVQCGYCTPGIVMELHALFSRKLDAEDAEIMKALDRHLCRCTGYEAIIEGAHLAQSSLAKIDKN